VRAAFFVLRARFTPGTGTPSETGRARPSAYRALSRRSSTIPAIRERAQKKRNVMRNAMIEPRKANRAARGRNTGRITSFSAALPVYSSEGLPSGIFCTWRRAPAGAAIRAGTETNEPARMK